MSDITLTVSAPGPTVDLTADAPGAVTVTVESGGGVSSHAALPDLATSGHPASVIAFTPTGSIAATTVQAAVAEVATDAAAAYQPLDSDLTAIAALSTTTYGRALLALADAAAGRTALALGTAATAASGDFQPIDSDLTAIAALSTTSYGRAFLALADAAAGRTALGLGGAATLNVGTSAGTVAAGDDSRFGAGGAPPLSSPASGFWWTTPGYPDTVSVTLNAAFAVPFVCPRAMTITRIGAEPSSAATAGSLVRLGIYTDSSGLPGTVLLDAGTILGTSATFQEITISQALSANTKYWFVMAAQGGGNVTMRASRGGFSIPQAYTTSGNEAGAIRQVGSTWSGALISPFPTVDDFRQAAPRFTIKVA